MEEGPYNIDKEHAQNERLTGTDQSHNNMGIISTSNLQT